MTSGVSSLHEEFAQQERYAWEPEPVPAPEPEVVIRVKDRRDLRCGIARLDRTFVVAGYALLSSTRAPIAARSVATRTHR